MYLSALLIAWHIQKQYPETVVSSWLSRDPILKYPLKYEGAFLPDDGIIYLADDPGLPLPTRRLSKNMVLFTGRCTCLPKLCKPSYCFLPETVTAGELLSFLQRLYDRYDRWNQCLIDSRLANGSIQQLLDLTDPVIPNPMMVAGKDFAIIASKKLTYGKLKNSVLGSTEATQPIVNALKQDVYYEESFDRTGYFYYPGNQVATPKLCVNIPRSGRTVFRLMISEGEVPLDDTFGFLLEYLAKMISHALSTNVVQSRDSSYTLHQIFLTLLTTPSADYVEISHQLAGAGWLSSHHYLCVLINVSILDTKNLTLRSICSYVEEIIPGSCAVEHQGNAVIYINLSLCPLDQNEIHQKLAGFIRDSLLTAGYGRSMLGHFNFYRQYIQASTALQVGSRQNPSRWIHQFNEIAMYYIYEQTTRKLPAYMICHEKLLELKYEDETNHTELYQTTRCYLELHQSIARTSEALFIHRSTLLYRLDKIKNILKTDFSDPQELLYLLLSFYLIEMEERH